MFWSAKEGTVHIKDSYVDYVTFGSGKKILILIPGLSVKGVKGTAIPLAFMYRIFAKDYKIYVFDRIHDVPDGYTVTDMADDIASTMCQLDIKCADIVGVSQGGMIAQALAINYPSAVHKLVLCVTLSKPNKTVKDVVKHWVEYAQKGDYKSLNRETFTLMYSDKYLKKNRLLLPIAVHLTKPDNLSKFERLANACVTFDNYDELTKISCPTLVLGGRKDKIVTGNASEAIAEKLSCEIYMYDDLGHGAYDEASDFNKRIYSFLK